MIHQITDRERTLSAQIDEQGGQLVAWRDRAIAAEAELARLRAVEPWDRGVFKGADGLRKLLDSQPYWDEQSYGTRLYFGPNINDYLHRDVLRAAVEYLERAAPPAQPAEPVQRLSDERIMELVIDYGVESLRLGSEEARHPGSNYRASFLREKRAEALKRVERAMIAAAPKGTT